VNVIEWVGLEDIVLVGHSYGGWVASGVAECPLGLIEGSYQTFPDGSGCNRHIE